MIVKNASGLTAPEQLEGRLKAAHLSPGESFIGIIPLWRAKIICPSRAARLERFMKFACRGLAIVLRQSRVSWRE